MSADPAQRIRQLEFERDYAEALTGRLYVQNQHMQETLQRLGMILQRYGIDPNTGEVLAEQGKDASLNGHDATAREDAHVIGTPA